MKKRYLFVSFLLIIFINFFMIYNCKALDSSENDRIHFTYHYTSNEASSSEGILIESNGHYGLIDTGNPSSSNYVDYDYSLYNGKTLAQYIKDNYQNSGSAHLDFIILTHAHSDHIGGITDLYDEGLINQNTTFIYKEYKNDLIGDSSEWHTDYYYQRAVNTMNLANAKQLLVEDTSVNNLNKINGTFVYNNGDASDYIEFTFNDFNIKIFNIYFAGEMAGENANSLVVLVTKNSHKLLFFSEANVKNETIQKISDYVGHVSFAKLGHYNSNNYISLSALKNINPDTMLLTGGNSNNTYKNALGVAISYGNENNKKVYGNEDFSNPMVAVVNNNDIEYYVNNSGVYQSLTSSDYLNATVSDGWSQIADTTEKTNWVYINNKTIVKGWLSNNGYWYYLQDEDTDTVSAGIMLMGWHQLEYMTNSNVLTNCTYYFTNNEEVSSNNPNGSMHIGWLNYHNQIYYFRPTSESNFPSGSMVTGWQKIDGYWYYFNEKIGNQTVIEGLPEGEMIIGWAEINGEWYYFNQSEVNSSIPSGAMATGLFKIYDENYYLNEKINGNLVVSNHPEGALIKGWLNLENYWYYFSEVEDEYEYYFLGQMYTDTCTTINNDAYCFGVDGKSETGNTPYNVINIPDYNYCKTTIYNGNEQTLTNNAGTGFTFSGNTGTIPNRYLVSATLQNGYIWNDLTLTNKTFYCDLLMADDTVTIIKQTADYSGSVVETVATSTSNTDITIEYFTDSSCEVPKENSPINAGTYYAIATSLGNDYYIGSSSDCSEAVVINKIPAVITCDNKIYNENYQTIASCSGGTVGNAFQRDAGNYSISCVGDDNHSNPSNNTCSILKSNTTTILNNITNTYDGTNQEATGAESSLTSNNSIINNGEYTYEYYSGDICSGEILEYAPKNASIYSVIATLTESSNYNSSTSNCATYTMNKKDSSIILEKNSLNLTYPIASDNSYTYDGDGEISCESADQTKVTCSVDSTNNKIIVTPQGVTSSEVLITVSASSGTNYNAPTTITFPTTIGATSPIITLESLSAPYTGYSIIANDAIVQLQNNETYSGLINYTYYESSNCSGIPLNGAPINVGNYSVKASVEANGNYTGAETCAIHTITKSNTTTIINDITKNYNGNPQAASGATSNLISNNESIIGGNYSYIYFTNDECSDEERLTPPIDAGIYYVQATLEETSNYNSSQSNCAIYTMNQIDATFEVTEANKILTYNISGENSYTYDGDGEISCESADSAKVTCSIDTINKKIILTPQGVTSSPVTITVKAGAGINYKASENQTFTVMVNAATPTVNLVAKSEVYTGSAIFANIATVQLLNNETYSGTIDYTYYGSSDCSGVSLEDAPTNVGNYSVKASIDASGNYIGAETCVTHAIIKSNTTTSLSSIIRSYNGNPQEASGATSILSSNEEAIINGAYTYSYYDNTNCNGEVLSNNPTNVGNYGVKATLTETSNYNASTSSCQSFVISDVAYQILLESNGGEIEENTKIVILGQAYGTLEIPYKEGYIFTGWWTNDVGGTEVTSDTVVTNPNTHTLYARYELLANEISQNDNYTINIDYLNVKENISIDSNLGLGNDVVVKVYTEDGYLKTSGLLATANEVAIYQNNKEIDRYTIIVKGDVIGNGSVSIGDVAKLYQFLRGKITMTDVYKKAGSVASSDNTIRISDVAKLYQYVRGTIGEL